MTSLPIGEGDDAIVRGSNTQSKPEQSLAFNPKRYPELFGEGSLGDIMSDGSQHSKRDALLVTSEGGSLATRFGVVSRLDRMALTANGNLQRLFSSYYDAPVHVVVDKCQQKTPEMWERQVHLKVFDQVFCTAESFITIHDPECQTLVQTGEVGLGQMFRYLDRLPTFELLDAGYAETGALWRLYRLKCKELSCRIREDFHPDAWELSVS